MKPTYLISLLLTVIGPSWSTTTLLSAQTVPSRPNIIVILTDDQGWGDLSFNGNTNLNTPNVDSLGRDGASFDRFYVSPVCSPTRAEFLTGRYHLRGGVYSTSAGGERLDLDEATIGEAFKAQGYATAAFGKWHNGMQAPYHPNSRGFDEFYGFCSGHWGNYFSPPLDHNGELVQGEGFVIDDFTTHAIDFIKDHQDQPFFTYLAYNTPHSPMQVPDEYWDKFAEKDLPLRHRDPDRENIEHTRAALAMCENIDWNVGRLLSQLEELDLASDTIVVYFCDNGPNGSRWNGDMKGRKGSTDEGGVRSPLLIRWPNMIPAGKVISEISGAIDLLPTLTDLAGFPAPRPQPLDGMSLKTLLTEENPAWPERLLFSHWRGRVSARSQQFRLDHQGNLFDLTNDPGQRRVVNETFPDVHTKLVRATEKWSQALLKSQPFPKRPFPIGSPDAKLTQLPARDAIGHGAIERSNRFPNCSFLGNWKNTDDYISWNADVLESGEYEVELHYTCSLENLGTTVQLVWGDQRLSSEVKEAHDPPLLGAENDRVTRVESYVKAFKPLVMGKIRLESGSGELQLRALEIPGEESIEFRLLTLRRVR